MKQKYYDLPEGNEMDILVNQVHLDSNEMFILGFLKGFDRNAMKEWTQKGLANYSY
ncbi:MAG: hypothetical protein PHF67_05285 [Candidatus Nanoarchaeia archaeon]|nr:hypothetical protein [Candidatus Nanoarchaeia archaeon]